MRLWRRIQQAHWSPPGEGKRGVMSVWRGAKMTKRKFSTLDAAKGRVVGKVFPADCFSCACCLLSREIPMSNAVRMCLPLQ